MNKKIVLLENNVPLDFRYRVTQNIVDQMRFLRMLEYSLQKITPTEKKARIKKQSKYRLLNWKRDPRLRLKHDIQSAKDETRSTRRTVQGLDIKKANALKPLLHTPNRKVV